jgi:putative transposase
VAVSVKCSALGVTQQGYYAHCRRRAGTSARSQRDAELTTAIRQAHQVGRQTYGTPRLKTALRAVGFAVSRRRIARLRDGAGLKIRCAKKFVQTTDSNHDDPIAPNLLDRDFTVAAPNTVWVSDITYLWVENHWLYLCTVIDLFANVVVGRKLSDSLDASIVTDALQMAVQSRRPPPGCIFHSDRGVQYACHAFRSALANHRFQQSMSRRANCWDNAVAESSFARLKIELGESFPSDADAVRAVYEYLDVLHNHIRIHTRINTTPAHYERMHSNLN